MSMRTFVRSLVRLLYNRSPALKAVVEMVGGGGAASF